MVWCQHGHMPVPVPAVAHLLRHRGVPVKPNAVEGELVTPTGAAILVHLVDRFTPSELTRIDRIGYGLGTREIPKHSNALRLLAQDDKETAQDLPVHRAWVVVLSSHLDDMNPEWYGPLWDRLFEGGALDVALIPMTMKKGRPGVRIEVVVSPGDEERLAHLVLHHTTTLGVRMATMERMVLPRTQQTIKTPWGGVRCKVSGTGRRVEHDDLAALAKRERWTLPEAQHRITPFLMDPHTETLEKKCLMDPHTETPE